MATETNNEEVKAISLEDAQKAVLQDKMEREKKFVEELDALCKKYNCIMSLGKMVIEAR